MGSLFKRDYLFLMVIVILGLFLRLWFLKDGAITFGFDQARDAFAAQEIYNGHLKIQGPSASTPGLFHGVFYYYLLVPPYFLGAGNPVAANIWLSIINILTIIPIYLFGKLFFSNRVGLLASFLFAISFDAVQYANWMSNPAPAVLTVALFYLGLGYYIFVRKADLAMVLTAIGLGLSIQSEVFLGYLFVPLLICLAVFKTWPTLKQILIFGGVFVLTVSSMILSYLKFGLTFIKGFASLYNVGGDPFGAWREFSPTLEIYLNRFAEYFYRGLMPFNVAFAGVIGLAIVFYLISWVRSGKQNSREVLFLLILLFSHGLMMPFGGQSTPFINAGLELVVLTIVSFFIVSFYSGHKYLSLALAFLIVFSCLNAIFKYNPYGQTVFAIQRGLTLKNELAAIDYTYNSSGGEKFSTNTVTSPLWINTVWAYLYSWYGQSKYGFVPSFHGRDQRGYPGANKLSEVTSQDKVYYLIIEPLAGIPVKFANDTIQNEDSFSKIVEEKDFGGIIVQKRIPTHSFEQIGFVR